jgi:lysophospholipase L1-like esterase
MMNFHLAKLLPVLVTASLVVGCEAEISGSSGKAADAGSTDFSTFVAIGDSLTAGFADSALYRHGQVNSYPAILAQQFALAGGGAFEQPLREKEFTGSFVGVPLEVARDRLMIVSSGKPDPPVTADTIDPIVPENLISMPGNLYNNFGVPLAKSFDLDSIGYANPFHLRFAFNPGVTSMLDDAVARMPTFFILWIGNNDILLNALSGSPGTANPTFGTGTTDVTPTADFAGTFPGLVDDLKSLTNKGLLVNIPRISTIPYFTTVPYDAIPLSAADAADLNAQLAFGYNLAVDAAFGRGIIPDRAEADKRKLSFSEGQNPVLIHDDTLTDISSELVGFLLPLAALAQARPATEDDFILLPTLSKLGNEDTPGDTLTKWGVTLPLEDADVLTKTEDDAIDKIRAAYNVVIKDEADANADILFFDAAAVLDEVHTSGLSYGSGGISSAYIQGGAFSADGIHPTARGYAVIANEISKVINKGFDAFIPPVDPSDYTTVFYQ